MQSRSDARPARVKHERHQLRRGRWLLAARVSDRAAALGVMLHQLGDPGMQTIEWQTVSRQHQHVVADSRSAPSERR